jgi:hypothetical protein
MELHTIFLRSELYRIAGVDLTDVPGVSAITAQVIRRSGCQPFPQRVCVRLLVGVMSGKTNQWGQGPVLEDPKGEEPSRTRTPDGR